MSPSRWLNWTPIMEKTPNHELTKPTKPNFVSFVSPTIGTFPIIEAARQEPGATQPREDFDPRLGDPCPCGCREWWKKPGATLECKSCGGLVRSRYRPTGRTLMVTNMEANPRIPTGNEPRAVETDHQPVIVGPICRCRSFRWPHALERHKELPGGITDWRLLSL